MFLQAPSEIYLGRGLLTSALLSVGELPASKEAGSRRRQSKDTGFEPAGSLFPVYPGDILRHVCKRDPVARQATPVFHR